MNKAVSGVLPLLLCALLLPAAPAMAREEPIRILSEEVENNFPTELFFHIEAESQAAKITRIKLAYRFRGAFSLTRSPLEFEPARRVQASYRWYTGSSLVPPGAPLLYYWEITDGAGNTLTTEERVYYYDDIRFDWQTLADEEVAVFWYEGGKEFGQRLYQVASTSLHNLQDAMGVELDFPVHVIVYANDEDFASAYVYVHDWVGGQSFPSMGLTVQVIAPWDDTYMVDVLPHEISHLLFFQLTDNPYVVPPAWLNEGLAQYNEWGGQEVLDELVAEAAAEGRLLPMAYIVGGFPPDERVYLAYAQSYSLVKTLVEEYGWEAMARYLNAFKTASLKFDEEAAFEAAFGLSFNDFLDLWLERVGAVGHPVLNPSPTPTLPPGVPTPTLLQPTPTLPPPPDDLQGGPCPGVGLLLLLPFLSWWLRRGGGSRVV